MVGIYGSCCLRRPSEHVSPLVSMRQRCSLNGSHSKLELSKLTAIALSNLIDIEASQASQWLTSYIETPNADGDCVEPSHNCRDIACISMVRLPRNSSEEDYRSISVREKALPVTDSHFEYSLLRLLSTFTC